ncbi:MAG: ABC transporter ATP-binding protein [Desulfosalsimonadaceae bacterium]
MTEPRLSPLLTAKGLCKSYPSGDGWVHPLRGVDITVCPGQFVAVTGPSGAGKSTLLHILGFLERPDKGSYHLREKDVSCLDDEALSRLRSSCVGFVFQAYNLISQYTLAENIAMPFLYHPKPPGNVSELALLALEEVGLSGRKTHRPNQLSGGEMQRAAIARALVIDPLVVLADEPTGNLDTENAGKIAHIFQKLHEKGTSLIVVTHDNEIARAADRVLHMNEGRLYE